jgi:hypothetical protein
MIAVNLAGGNGTPKALRTQVTQELRMLFEKGGLKDQFQIRKPDDTGLFIFNGSLAKCLEKKPIYPVIRL